MATKKTAGSTVKAKPSTTASRKTKTSMAKRKKPAASTNAAEQKFSQPSAKVTRKTSKKVTTTVGKAQAEAPFSQLEELASRLTGNVEEAQRKISELKQDLQSVHKESQKRWSPQTLSVPATLEEDLDQVSRVFKRTLVEVVERNSERLSHPLVTLERRLQKLARRSSDEFPGISAELDTCLGALSSVLEQLGIEKFHAEEREVFDPMIHQAAGEDSRKGLDDGRIISSVAPGYRSHTGRVLLPAQVVVNRR